MSSEGDPMTETSTPRPGRNDRCHCGSGKKYKQCCLQADAAADRAARAEAAAAAPVSVADEEGTKQKPEHKTAHGRDASQSWRRGQTQGSSLRKSGPRTRGGI